MSVMVGDGRILNGLWLQLDAAPTIDMVLYFRVETKEDGVDLIDTSSSGTS